MQQYKLQVAKAGTFVQLLAIENRESPHVKRLEELGLVEGARLEVIRNSRSKMPIILEVNGSKLCLERDLAAHFLVCEGVQE